MLTLGVEGPTLYQGLGVSYTPPIEILSIEVRVPVYIPAVVRITYIGYFDHSCWWKKVSGVYDGVLKLEGGSAYLCSVLCMPPAILVYTVCLLSHTLLRLLSV